MKTNTFIYLILINLIIYGCSSSNDSENNMNNVSQFQEENYTLDKSLFKSKEFKLDKISETDFHEIIQTNGIIDVPPYNKASISCFYGGKIKELNILVGEKVTKGQVLFTLENPIFVEMQQEYLEAKGLINFLQSDYERQKNLSEDNVVSKKNFIKAESDYMVTKVRMESLAKKLLLININPNDLTISKIQSVISITSPIDGFITQVNISKGSFLDPAQNVISIVNTNSLQLQLNVFEKDISKLEIGKKIKFNIQDDKSKEFDSEIHLINKSVNTTDRTIGVYGNLLDKKVVNLISPGMYIEAKIYTASSRKPSLPKNAVIKVENKNYILVLKDSLNNSYSFTKKEVKVGEEFNEFIEILNSKDFNGNNLFLVNGAFNLIK